MIKAKAQSSQFTKCQVILAHMTQAVGGMLNTTNLTYKTKPCSFGTLCVLCTHTLNAILLLLDILRGTRNLVFSNMSG